MLLQIRQDGVQAVGRRLNSPGVQLLQKPADRLDRQIVGFLGIVDDVGEADEPAGPETEPVGQGGPGLTGAPGQIHGAFGGVADSHSPSRRQKGFQDPVVLMDGIRGNQVFHPAGGAPGGAAQ